MKMSEFSQAGSWAKIASDLFPGADHPEIYFASDAVMAKEVQKFTPNAVIYGPGELARIMALNPGEETVKQIHRAKEILGGRVITTTPKEEGDGENRKGLQRDMDTSGALAQSRPNSNRGGVIGGD